MSSRAALMLCATLVAGTAAAQGPPPAPPYVAPAPGKPVEARPPNATGQMPAFKEQTRAPYTPSSVALNVETITDALQFPWGMAFLPDGRILVSERKGKMRIVSGSTVSAPLEGLPPVHEQGVSGLMDVILDPDFKNNRLIYWSYVEARGGGADTSVARGRLVDGPTPHLEDVTVIYRQQPDLKSIYSNFGGRLLFDRKGALFVPLGDLAADELRPYVQNLANSVGKLVRITTSGKAAKGDPFLGKPGVAPEIWATGFRNPLGIAFRPGTQDLWMTDVGARGGDELNRIRAGRNYGWPITSYGKEYSGKQIGEGTHKQGFEQPVYYWDPVISPSSLIFYDGALFPAWKGNAFVTSLSQRHLTRLVLKGDKVVGEERLLTDVGERLRQVKQGPDGALYILTDMEKGKLLRVTPVAK
jgi:glucose/arabinose dehydrogenase